MTAHRTNGPAAGKRIGFGLVMSVLFMLSGLALATSYPLTVTDDLGRELTLMAAPERIITMIPSHTETVCALGACERLVGVDEFSNYPAEVNDLPHLGSAFAPNIEEIVALEPDLVLVEESTDIAQTLSDLGYPVYAGTAQTLDEVYALFSVIGELIDRETEAALLTGRVEGAVAEIAAMTAALPARSVFYELDATPYSVGPGSFIGELIAKAGGANIVEAGMGDFPQLDPEFVIVADPDIIVLADAPFGESLETLMARPGWDSLSAAGSGGVVPLTSEQVDLVNRPGPRVAEALLLFAHIFHPSLFD